MNYRQWKKNYKKKHGVNPPIIIDKRKQVRFINKWFKSYDKQIELLKKRYAVHIRENCKNAIYCF